MECYTAQIVLNCYDIRRPGKEYKVPEGVTELGYCAFKDSSLESVELPDSLKKISVAAFADCKKLKSIEIPASVGEIEGLAFQDCESLESVVYQGKKPEIEDNAFRNCQLLEEITEPETSRQHLADHYSVFEKAKTMEITDSIFD